MQGGLQNGARASQNQALVPRQFDDPEEEEIWTRNISSSPSNGKKNSGDLERRPGNGEPIDDIRSKFDISALVSYYLDGGVSESGDWSNNLMDDDLGSVDSRSVVCKNEHHGTVGTESSVYEKMTEFDKDIIGIDHVKNGNGEEELDIEALVSFYLDGDGPWYKEFECSLLHDGLWENQTDDFDISYVSNENIGMENFSNGDCDLFFDDRDYFARSFTEHLLEIDRVPWNTLNIELNDDDWGTPLRQEVLLQSYRAFGDNMRKFVDGALSDSIELGKQDVARKALKNFDYPNPCEFKWKDGRFRWN